MSAVEIPYAALPNSGVAFAPAGPDRATARLELNRDGVVAIASGISGFKLLRLGGSAFHGFVRDEYTTLPDIANRPLHMWLDLEWLYTESPAAFSSGSVTATVRRIVRDVFHGFESGSIQQVIYQIGTKDAGGYSEHRRGSPGSQQSNLGHHRRTRRTNWAFTPKPGPPLAFLAYA